MPVAPGVSLQRLRDVVLLILRPPVLRHRRFAQRRDGTRRAAPGLLAVCPGASRPKTRSHHVLRRSSELSAPRMIGSVPSGTATSNVRPTSTPKKSGGDTPTTVNAWPSSVDRFARAPADRRRTPAARSRDSAPRRGRPSRLPHVVVCGEGAADDGRDAEHVEEAAADEQPSTGRASPPAFRLKRAPPCASTPLNSPGGRAGTPTAGS